MTKFGEWQPVKGYEGKYEVSSIGHVRKAGGSEIGQWPNQLGYMLVRLSGPRKMFRVHRLVAEAFLPNPNNLPVVNHLDHDRQNNAASNLEWCDQKRNLSHAAESGRLRRDYWKGKRSPNAKLSDAAALNIRRAYSDKQNSLQSLALEYGMSKRAIERIVNGRSYVPLPEPPQ